MYYAMCQPISKLYYSQNMKIRNTVCTVLYLEYGWCTNVLFRKIAKFRNMYSRKCMALSTYTGFSRCTYTVQYQRVKKNLCIRAIFAENNFKHNFKNKEGNNIAVYLCIKPIFQSLSGFSNLAE